MKKLVHYIFLDIGLGTLNTHPSYLNNMKRLKQLTPSIKTELWDESRLDDLVKKSYPNLLEFWNNFPSLFYKIDFGRYLILAKYGGMYIDLDMKPLQPIDDLFKRDMVCSGFKERTGKTSFNNNIIYFKDKKINELLIDYAIYRYINNKMPSSWKRRRMLYTVGARMFHKFCSESKYNISSDLSNYFKDEQTKSWLKVEV